MSDNLYRYGIIGTGIPHGEEGATGFGMAHSHWTNFRPLGRVDLVSIADVRESVARHFLDRYQSDAKYYSDYKQMLANENLDIVSVTVWPHLHAEMTIAACEAGVKAVHCEKPIAIGWGDCKRMKAAAEANGVKLTFNHQRRHIKMFQAVRQALRDGAVGELVTIEAEVGDMFDWGTHWLDMMFFYNDDTPAEWVIGQIDSRTEKRIFGAYGENQAITHFKWQNGVRGTMIAGYQAKIGCIHRITGKDGVLEVLSERTYRVRRAGKPDWEVVEVPQGDIHELGLAMADVVRQLDEPGYKSILSVDYAIQHTEVIFATYHSSKIRGRVDLPLSYDGNSLLDLVASGEVGPNRKESL